MLNKNVDSIEDPTIGAIKLYKNHLRIKEMK